jgi:outer membrane protein TolC
VKRFFIMLCVLFVHFQCDGQILEDFSFQNPDIQNADTLTLQQVFAVINANHPKLQVSELGVQSAKASVLSAWGRLDPAINGEITSKNETDKFKQQTAMAELSIPIFWGQKISASWKRNIGLFDQDNSTSLNGESTIGISFPLWRNILIDKNRAAILKAEQLPTIADAAIIENRNELFLKSSEKYWEWSGALMKYSIAKNLLRLAEIRLSGIIEEHKKGERAKIDSIEMTQELLRRKGLLIKSRRDYEKAAIAVGQYIWNKDGTPALFPSDIVPTSMNDPLLISKLTYANDKEKALKTRPEISQIRGEISMADIETQLTNELWKPDINVKFAPFNTQSFQDGSQQIDYKIGVQAEMPLLLRNANGVKQQAEVKQQSLQLKESLLLRTISAEIDDATSELIASYQQYIAAKQENNAAIQMENAERQLLIQGESSLFTVNLRERFSAESAGRVVDALIQYHKAFSMYQWSIAGF